MNRILIAAMLAIVTGGAHAQTADTVGDVDSYGRASIYLGAKQSEYFGSATACTSNVFPVLSNCIAAPPAGQRLNATMPNVVRIDLPARAANSQVCFDLSPTMMFTHQNPASAPARARTYLTVNARVRFHSPVLDDPTILAPNGLPFPNGEIVLGTTMLQDYRSLEPGESEPGYQEWTRRCAGMVFSKQKLVSSYGLTRAQADLIFNQPITISVDGVYVTEYVSFLRLRYHVAIFGDKR